MPRHYANLNKERPPYKVRHRILKALYSSTDNSMGTILLNRSTGLNITDIEKFSQRLLNENEITTSNVMDQLFLTITDVGKNSYIDRKYINERKKFLAENFLKWVGFLINFLTLIFSIYIFFANRSLQTRVEQLERKVEQLEAKYRHI